MRWQEHGIRNTALSHSEMNPQVIYQLIMESSHCRAAAFIFVNACSQNCCDQNVHFGRNASFGKNGANVAQGINTAHSMLLVTAESSYRFINGQRAASFI